MARPALKAKAGELAQIQIENQSTLINTGEVLEIALFSVNQAQVQTSPTESPRSRYVTQRPPLKPTLGFFIPAAIMNFLKNFFSTKFAS
jgi:hypothetical protein